MSQLWKSMSIIFVALIVGAAIVALVVIQPWENGAGDVAPATRQPTAAPKPRLTAGEVCSIVREKQQRQCCKECTASFSASLGSWNIDCEGTSRYADRHFSYREETGIVVPENQEADACLRPAPTRRP